MFFALSGENFNGNKFAKAALDLGAKFAVIDDSDFQLDDKYILVDNTLETLQNLAKHHRSLFKKPVIGLTGSNGKTTTKELIHAVLSTSFKVATTKGNFNNHIGVPLTLLSIHPEDDIAVIEMGANHVGEIAVLCEIAMPTHGFITNIGKAHLGGFGGPEGVLRGKTELFDFLRKHDGKVFINSQDAVLSNMGKRFKKPIYFPSENDYLNVELIDVDPFVVFKGESGKVIKTQLPGVYNFSNIATALCIAKYFNVPANEAESAIANYSPEMNRSQIIKRGTNTVILDAYNANPDSMKSALENFAMMKADYKVVILGDMLELGQHATEEHQKLGKLVASINPDEAIFCGELTAISHNEVKNSRHFSSSEALLKSFKIDSLSNALVLIKGSRGMALERLIQ